MQCVFSGQRHLLGVLFWEVSYGAHKESWRCIDLCNSQIILTYKNCHFDLPSAKIGGWQNQVRDKIMLPSDCIREKALP